MEGGKLQNFLKLAFKCMEMYSNDIVSLLFDHRSPRWRMGSARNIKDWLLNARKSTQMTLYLYYLIIVAPGERWVVPAF